MGLLAEIYLAKDDAKKVKYDTAPDTFVDRLQYKGITELELSAVGRAIRLMCRLPDAMLRDLVNLTPQQVAAAAEKWGATEGLDNTPARVRPIIAGLANLARKAAEVNPSVYLWNSV